LNTRFSENIKNGYERLLQLCVVISLNAQLTVGRACMSWCNWPCSEMFHDPLASRCTLPENVDSKPLPILLDNSKEKSKKTTEFACNLETVYML